MPVRRRIAVLRLRLPPLRLFPLRLFPLLLIPLLSVPTGCGEGGGNGWTTVRDTLPGGAVRVVHTPPASGPGVTWRLEEEVRIGAIEGGGPESFGEVRGIAVDGAGRIAVLDAQAREVRVFGPEGEHLRTFGGQGGGPGELEGPFGLAWAPDGLLRVADVRNARMSLFDPVEGFVRSHPVRFWRWGYIWDGVVDSAGRVWQPSMGMVDGTSWDMIRIYNDSMRQVDSIPIAERPERSGPDRDPPGAFFWETGGGFGYYTIPYYPRGQRALDPRGVYWGTTEGDPSYRVARWIPGGDTTLIVESSRPAVPVTQAERDSAIAHIREYITEAGGDANLDWSRIPQTRPAVEGVHLAENGDVWVRLPVPGDSVALYDVFSPQGQYRGTARGTLQVFPYLAPVIRGDRFYAVVTDELGVSYVVRARITPLEGAGTVAGD